MDSEDSTLIKTFLLVWWFDDKQRRLMVAIGSRGWFEKVLWFGWAFGEEESEKNHVFHAEEHIYNL